VTRRQSPTALRQENNAVGLYSEGAYQVPTQFPTTPRQERDEAMFAIAELLEEGLANLGTALARCQREGTHIREQAAKAARHLRTAQELQDGPYDGVERRRESRVRV
jgi:acyl-CoA reductase-like NAD-dependent aldehyde dehydrogenase